MNLDKHIWQQTSILVLCSSTVKEPVSSTIWVYKQTILLHICHGRLCVRLYLNGSSLLKLREHDLNTVVRGWGAFSRALSVPQNGQNYLWNKSQLAIRVYKHGTMQEHSKIELGKLYIMSLLHDSNPQNPRFGCCLLFYIFTKWCHIFHAHGWLWHHVTVQCHIAESHSNMMSLFMM